MAWTDTKVDGVDTLPAAEYNTMTTYIQTRTPGFDYYVYKDGSTYYAHKCNTRSEVSSAAKVETVLNAVAADIDAEATIGFAGDTTYTFGTGTGGSTVTFTDQQVYIDGSNATFDISSSNCSVFYWHNATFHADSSSLMGCGIRNCQVDGDQTNTNEIFASFYRSVSADIYNLRTRNVGTRAVYNMITLKHGGKFSSIRDCYIYGEYPIRLLGASGSTGEPSRSVIDHCQLSGSGSNDATYCIEITYGQYIGIINCFFTNCDTAIYTRDTGELRITNCGIGGYNDCGLDIDSTYANISNNAFVNEESSTTDIAIWEVIGGCISNNNFNINGDNNTTIYANGTDHLSVTDNVYRVQGPQSNCTFIKQTADDGNWWTVANNNIIGTGVQTGVCMMFDDIRNSYIGDNNIGCAPAGGVHLGSIPWSSGNFIIDAERNTIVSDLCSSITGDHTAVMGETIIADASGASITITLPAFHAFQGMKTAITVKKIDEDAPTGHWVTLDGTGGDTIDGSTTYRLSDQYDSVTVMSKGDGDTWYIVQEKT